MRHPRQVGGRPIAFLILGMRNGGNGRTGNLQLKVLRETERINAVYKLGCTGNATVGFIDKFGNADVGRIPNGLLGIDEAVAALAVVMVAHDAAVYVGNTRTDIYRCIGFEQTVLQSGHHGNGLEGGTRFAMVAAGIVLRFGIHARCYAAQVTDGLYASGSGFHQNGTARFGIGFHQFATQRRLHDILFVEIDGGVQVPAVHRINGIDIDVASGHLLPRRQARLAT